MKTALKWVKWILIGTFVLGFMVCFIAIMGSVSEKKECK